MEPYIWIFGIGMLLMCYNAYRALRHKRKSLDKKYPLFIVLSFDQLVEKFPIIGAMKKANVTASSIAQLINAIPEGGWKENGVRYVIYTIVVGGQDGCSYIFKSEYL